jgi:hypothetical protein
MVDTVNESVKKLIRELEPLIVDLDDAMIELRIKQEEFERVSRFLAYVNSDVHMVGIYADQNFILENLDKVNGTKDKYKASCYLLKNEEDGVKALPQYQEANDYMLRLINYFKTNKMELANIIQKLDNKCKEKSLNKKYYELFNRENPLIEDLGEFSEFLNKYVTESDDKIDILTYVINNNLLNYKGIKS